MINYKSVSNAQNAATAAANVAEIKSTGPAGHSPTASWDASTKTLSEVTVTAQIVSGVQKTSDTAIKVSVSRRCR